MDRAVTAINSIANKRPLVAVARSLIALMGGVLRTAWILIQGFRILTGPSRDSMMAMVMDMSRIGVIVAAATVMAVGSSDLQKFLGADGGLSRDINQLVTGSDDSVAGSIDKNLAYTQLAMGAIQAIPVPNDDVANSDAQSRASLIALLGVAGPPMTAGAMLLMYKVAIALVIGFGPLFILCLIFEQTKSFFSRWLMFGLATLFSMAVLNFMVSIVLQLTLKVAEAMWSATVINALLGTSAEGFTNQSLQQGGVGLLMTLLLVSAPAMAAAFFGGTVGQSYTSAALAGSGGGGKQGPAGEMPGTYVQQVSQRAESAPPAQSGGLGSRAAGAPPPKDTVKTPGPPSPTSGA